MAPSQSGLGTGAIARKTRVAPNTIRDWPRAGTAPTWHKGERAGLDPFLPRLERRPEEGERDATELWREVRSLGFAGQAVGARARVATLRADNPSCARRAGKPVWQRPTPRRTAHLLPCGPEAALRRP